MLRGYRVADDQVFSEVLEAKFGSSGNCVFKPQFRWNRVDLRLSFAADGTTELPARQRRVM